MRKTRVAVGLSGGVDSAVSAYLLKKQGFDVSGVYLHCFDDDTPGCRGKQDRQNALSVALHLKIPFQVLDFSKQYKAAVIGYFKKEYLAGRTPNPDVVCNRDIKFGLFLDWAVKAGFDYIATGHYARLVTLADSRNSRTTAKYANPRAFAIFANFRDFREKKVDNKPELERIPDDVILTQPKDLHKDQTYFLWAVPRQKFSRVLFPLADFRKQDVRSVAKFAKIPVADKPDSTGICFIGEVRVGDFLKRLGVKEKEGEVVIINRQSVAVVKPVSASGGVRRNRLAKRASQTQPANDFVVIGRHRGVWFYTIGQRHGFTINPKGLTFASQRLDLDIPPLYVIAKDVRRNRLIVGFGPECYRSQFRCEQLNWQIPNPKSQIPKLKSIFARIRHGSNLIQCRLELGACELKISLSEAQRGIAPGQSAVFYLKDGIILGGGVIQ